MEKLFVCSQIPRMLDNLMVAIGLPFYPFQGNFETTECPVFSVSGSTRVSLLCTSWDSFTLCVVSSQSKFEVQVVLSHYNQFLCIWLVNDQECLQWCSACLQLIFIFQLHFQFSCYFPLLFIPHSSLFFYLNSINLIPSPLMLWFLPNSTNLVLCNHSSLNQYGYGMLLFIC